MRTPITAPAALRSPGPPVPRSLRSRLQILGLGALVLLLSAGPSVAREAIVVLKDGRQLRGEVLKEDDSGITLQIAGLPFPVKAEDIREKQYVLSVEEQYGQKKAQLEDKDLEGRYKLVTWLYETWQAQDTDTALKLADKELGELVELFPDDGRVTRFHALVKSRLKVLESKDLQDAEDEPEDVQTEGPEQGLPDGKAVPDSGIGIDIGIDQKLSEEQVDLIRVYEVDLDATPKPRVTVPRDVRMKLLSEYADRDEVPKGTRDQARFLSEPGWKVLELIFAVGAKQYYPQVSVADDSEAMRTFRVTVHQRYVLSYCGTVDCHGGPQAGDFFVFRARPNDVQTVYTNFYILHRYQNRDGLMLDRSNPERSLLLQYGLPVAQASTPHPGPDLARGWRHRLPTPAHNRAQLLTAWIQSLWTPAPNYGINYTPPTFPKAQRPEKPDPAAAAGSKPQGQDGGAAADQE